MMLGSPLEFALEASVYGTASVLLMCFAFLVTRLLKKGSAALRHMVWLSAFVTLLAFPAVRFAIPHSRFVIAHRELPAPAPQAVEVSVTTAVPTHSQDQVISDVDSLTTEAVTAVPISPKPAPAQRSNVPELIALAWASGTVLCLFQIGAAVVRLRRLRTRSANEQFVAAAPKWVDRIGVRLDWMLRINEENAPQVAMTWGAVKPTVLLPDTSISWSDQRLEAVMLHELAHVRRRDCASQLLTAAVCALYWFNPLVWLGARAMRAEAESAADDLVLKSGIKPSAYAGELLRLAAELGRKKQPIGVVGVSIMKHSKIESRVVAILDSSRRRRGAGQLEAIGILALALTMCVPFASIKPTVDTDAHGGLLALTQDLADSSDFAASQNDLAMAVATMDDQARPTPNPTPNPTPKPQPKPKHVKVKVSKHVKPAYADSVGALVEANRQLKLDLQREVAAYQQLARQQVSEAKSAKLHAVLAKILNTDIQKAMKVQAPAFDDNAKQRQVLIEEIQRNSQVVPLNIKVDPQIVPLTTATTDEIVTTLGANKQDAVTTRTITVRPNVQFVTADPKVDFKTDGKNYRVNLKYDVTTALSGANQNLTITTPDFQVVTVDPKTAVRNYNVDLKYYLSKVARAKDQNSSTVTITNSDTVKNTADLLRSQAAINSKAMSGVITLHTQSQTDVRALSDLIRTGVTSQANSKALSDMVRLRIRLLDAASTLSARSREDAGFRLKEARMNLELALQALKRQSARLKNDKAQQARLQRAQQALEHAQRELQKSHG